MRKLSVKNLIDFRGRSKRSKEWFAQSLKANKVITAADGGGDYWITSLSAIGNAFKNDNLEIINDKIEELQGKCTNVVSRTKDMHQRNIANLENYKDISLTKLRPSGKLLFLKKSTGSLVLQIKGLQVEARPSHVFVYKKAGIERVGAIWFVSRLKGYSIEEMSMFCDMLHRFLDTNYSTKYQVSDEYCVVTDMFSKEILNYLAIRGRGLAQVLNRTLDEINSLM